MTQTALILGANGRFGRHAAHAFAKAGWTVTRFDRTRDDLQAEVAKAQIVVNAWNPPDYTTWDRDLRGLHQRVIDAMRHSDATVIVPGNVYVFGAETPGPWGADTPHRATNPLGKLRIQVEAAYRDAGIRTIVLRGGDFLDTQATGNWFDMIMVKQLAKGRLIYPGALDTAHAWAFLPDITRAAVELAEMCSELPRYADIPFAGYSFTGTEIASALQTALGSSITAKTLNWVPLKVLAPVWPKLRGLNEMRYLWNTPHRLDTEPLRQYLPAFEATPVAQALRAATQFVDLPRGSVQDATWASGV